MNRLLTHLAAMHGPPRYVTLAFATDIGTRQLIALYPDGSTLGLHDLQAGVEEDHAHAHRRSFWTYVLAGSYDDLYPDGEVREALTAGMVRFRPAPHRHRVRVGPDGARTLVLHTFTS